MKAATLIGIIVACVGMAIGATMEGSQVTAILNPSAMLIVLGGTAGAALASVGMERFKLIPTLYKKAFTPEDFDLVGRVRELVGYAEQARRDGLLSLDETLNTVEDPYIKKGLQLVVDGTDPELVAEILESENQALHQRHALGRQAFEKAGGYAPTMGIIGTVFGLIHVLQNLDAPETLGPAISSAFIATLIGVASANVIYLPIGSRLKALSTEELHFRQMTLEGVLAIQAGDNPRVVEEKLMAYVPPELRAASDAETADSGSASERAAA
jgi:chemotaxis protein MotA